MAREFVDSLLHHESPISWAVMQGLILTHRNAGIPKAELPNSFIMSEKLVGAMDEMHPRMNRFAYMQLVWMISLGRMQELDEVGRLLIANEDFSKLQVQTRNSGEVKRTLNAQKLTQSSHVRMVGHMHSHPIDSFPTGTDLSSILLGDLVVEIIPTPRRIHFLLRTTDTVVYDNEDVVKGYLREMGRAKGKTADQQYRTIFDSSNLFGFEDIISDYLDPDVWTVDDRDLKQLHIVRYEGSRTGQRLVRMV
jgi:hypothetical protein